MSTAGHGHDPNISQTQSGPPSKDIWEWTARIHASKSELGCSYNVIIFLGQVPDDPEEWLVSTHLVGKHAVLLGGNNHHRSGGYITEGFVHLNPAIVKRSGLGSLEPEDVVPYLTNELQWRVQKVDGSVAELESLEVVVFATPLTYQPGEMFPVPGEARRYNSITHGRHGGSRDDISE
ncbi:hypothetical protein BDZ97DRAFT_889457 [Flammula alnicola]|nr:hypothetical protein BDZ97DRAFT_889457 [Flammula alnicola]